jgi:hypothetical protein
MSTQITEGDWVRTPSGSIGQVVAVANLMAFVEIIDGQKAIVSHLLSELMTTEPKKEVGRAATHDALRDLLQITEKQLAHMEMKLLESPTVVETASLIETAAELQLKRLELLEILSCHGSGNDTVITRD